MTVLTDEKLIEELRRAFMAETDGIEPRPGALGRVHLELAAPAGNGASAHRRRFSAAAVFAALGTAVAVAVIVIALLAAHRGGSPGPPSGVVPVGAVRIAATALDPSGGPRWGLRTVQTGRLQACVQVGRLQGGQIGALGQDGAFGNDHRFHPIPLGRNFTCNQTDARGRLFLNVFARQVPASGALGGSAACFVGPAPGVLLHASRGRSRCPANDLRDLAYGALGPDAVSVTYPVNGRSVTVPTGPDGAYLVVLPAQKQSCTFGSRGGRGCIGGSGEITTANLQAGVITAVTYRDGHVCHLPAPTDAGVRQAQCPNIGYVHYPPVHVPHIAPAQVSATVTPSYVIGSRFCYRPHKGVLNTVDIPCDHGIPRGYKIGMNGQRTMVIHLSFLARVAATNVHSVYEWSLGRASGPHCQGSGGGVSATTMVPIRAGQHVVLEDNEAPCRGTYLGLVTYQPNGGPGSDTVDWQAPIRDGSILVGRFRFVVR